MTCVRSVGHYLVLHYFVNFKGTLRMPLLAMVEARSSPRVNSIVETKSQKKIKRSINEIS